MVASHLLRHKVRNICLKFSQPASSPCSFSPYHRQASAAGRCTGGLHCVSVIKLPVSTFELTFVATILGRSMTCDVVHERFPSNGYHVAQYLSSGRAPCRVHLPEADACPSLNGSNEIGRGGRQAEEAKNILTLFTNVVLSSSLR